MKHQRQGPQECLPTSVAIVLDVPRVEVIKRAIPEEYRSLQWAEYTLKMRPVSRAYRRLADEWAPWLHSAFNAAYITRKSCGPRRFREYVEAGESGVLVAMGLWYGGHAVAFGDGLVFDPQAVAPERCEKWLARSIDDIASAYIAIAPAPTPRP